jgi:hypothetical protein
MVFGIQMLLGILLTILLFAIFKIKEYDLIKNAVLQIISRTKNK